LGPNTPHDNIPSKHYTENLTLNMLPSFVARIMDAHTTYNTGGSQDLEERPI
jgi:hypothetical protein